MWPFNRSKKNKQEELRSYLKQVRAYEDIAFEYLALDQVEKAINAYDKIFEIPQPSPINSEDVISIKLADKFSRIRLKLDSLRSRIKRGI